MPEYLSIDWQSDRLCCVVGVAGAASAQIHDCFQIDWPEPIDPAADPSRAGKWLAEQLSGRQVRTRQVLLSLPRQGIMLRSLSVPEVADDQLPDLVRLQAETNYGASLEDQILDFLPLKRSPTADSRQVLMVTLASQRLKQIRQVLEAAGLTLAKAGISSIATAELIAHSARRGDGDDHNMALVVAKHDRRLEISLTRDDQVLFMHATQIASEQGQTRSRAVWAEIRRALGSVSRTDANAAVTHASLIGMTSKSSLATLLKNQLSCEIATVDLKTAAHIDYKCPPDAIDQGFFAGALGMLFAADDPIVDAIDFLRPRRTPERIDHGKRRIQAIVGIALVASAVAYGVTHWRVAGLTASIDTKQADITRMSAAVEAGQPVLKAANSVATWEKDVVDWLQFMSDVNAILPGTDRIYLRDCQFKTLAAASQTQVQATGYAKARRDVEQLYQRLAQQAFQVRPHVIGRTDDDEDYPFSFRIDVVMPHAMLSSSPR